MRDESSGVQATLSEIAKTLHGKEKEKIEAVPLPSATQNSQALLPQAKK
jgi:hypothetical protein